MKDKYLYYVFGIGMLIMVVAGYFFILRPVSVVNNIPLPVQQSVVVNDTIDNCDLTITPDIICAGSLATGVINAEPGIGCSIYVNYNGLGNNLLGNILVGSSGTYSTIEELKAPGSYVFNIVCGSCLKQATTSVRFCLG